VSIKDFPYIPLDNKGWRMAMGLRPLDLANWLEVDHNRSAELELKRQLLSEKFETVVATNPEGDEASAELLTCIEESLKEFHSEISFTIDRSEHPIVSASRLVQEDLCVLVKSDDWRLQAASVCFPSRWDLSTKIGTTLDAIHSPVPDYDAELGSPTNAFFDRLKPDRSFWRLNWTLLDNPALHQPLSVRRSPSGELDDWYFRVERQTLRQLPKTNAIVFTIRNYVAPAKMLRELDPEFGPNLLAALDSAPESMQGYKGWLGVADKLRSELS
jgi:hypothetical protein